MEIDMIFLRAGISGFRQCFFKALRCDGKHLPSLGRLWTLLPGESAHR